MSCCIPLPNILTIGRMSLIFVTLPLIYFGDLYGRLIAAGLAIAVVIGDWLDGHLARRLNQESKLGSLLDIVADRMLEYVMWVVLADLRLIPVWIPVLVISRGILTDAIRSYALSVGRSGFGDQSINRSRIGNFLTGSPLIRTPYAVLKAFSFGWLLLIYALQKITGLYPLTSAETIETGLSIGHWAAVAAALICIARGLPVVIEGLSLVRQTADQ
jgi:CDP-diacylglycerol--glycerol-3-phosphate 3-phosphatidyltransferase